MHRKFVTAVKKQANKDERLMPAPDSHGTEYLFHGYPVPETGHGIMVLVVRVQGTGTKTKLI